MEELINNHLAVMDSVNPQKWVKLIIDEWGTWYDVEPGTNPDFCISKIQCVMLL